MSLDEARLARQALLAAGGCARRLERSRQKLAGYFPIGAATIAMLSPDAEDDLDAFLKRFEQLVNILQDDLFKAVAVLGGEDIRGLARREIAELMERLGVIPSAGSFRVLVAIRNRVAHVYPDDPERQARNVNEAYAAVADLMRAHATARRYLEERLSRPETAP
jgi:uncharacterized protein YutE (UPF0331/DUF86 family)